jgi:hypothetical protein
MATHHKPIIYPNLSARRIQTEPQKAKIPKALREQIWLKYVGKKYESKCCTTWCINNISVFDFQCGHNIPESRGGPTTIDNLVPICARCNLSMGSQYTFDEWCSKFSPQQNKKIGFLDKLFCRGSSIAPGGLKDAI